MPVHEKRLLAMNEKPAENLLREPFEFLTADQYRHQLLCDILSSMSSGCQEDAGRPTAASMSHYLQNDYVQHLNDEADSLFPVLRRKPFLKNETIAVMDMLERELETCRLLALGLTECLLEFSLSGQISEQK